MANEQNTITVIGNLTKDPDLRYTQGGTAVANLSVAVNRRVRNKDTNEWEDKLDGYFDVNIWRDHAENVAESLNKGDRVVVIGRLTKRSWEDKDGQTRWQTEIEADEICPSLRWAKASVEKVSGGGKRQPAMSGGGQAPPPVADDEVPF
ncbi:Single-stranded DNA-binding protein (plasmid) [Euzebya pacifica]|uniref:Single-stranded DNA-binding protein n=1 Tax=Euzebya pacifica TaxID=1608957 RepID=A0A346Y5S5_9ACTN|nr:single-stranded DNA-binding protein [Euzebya pacifica]AXV09822.1 Single-stranded DNA-binding protein [Euzebya pacifica]